MEISREEFKSLLDIQNKTSQQLEKLAQATPNQKGFKLNGEAEVLYNKLKSDIESSKLIDDARWAEQARSSKEFKEGVNEFKKAVTDSINEMRKIFLEYVQKDKKEPWDWKSIAIIAALVFGVAGFLGQNMAFLWTTMNTGYGELKREAVERDTRLRTLHQLEVDDLKKRLDAMDVGLQREMRDVSAVNETKIENLDTTLQREMRLLREADVINTAKNEQEISRIREWKDHVEQTQGAIDAEQSTAIKNIKELLDAKSVCRFTGAEGKMVQKQIDRLEVEKGRMEDRLSFLTKELLNKENKSE